MTPLDICIACIDDPAVIEKILARLDARTAKADTFATAALPGAARAPRLGLMRRTPHQQVSAAG